MGDEIRADQFLIIIGAAKCGTTSLFDYLSQHPAVCPSVTKETDYFLERRRRFAHVKQYTEFWPDFNPAVHRYALEGSTHYSMCHEQRGVPERMREHGLAPRLIYVVRDPIKRIESHVNYNVMYSRGHSSFEDSRVVDASRYAMQLAPYIGAFGRESIRVLEFAELCENPNEVCAELFSWLGLVPHVIKDLGIANESAGVKTSHLERMEILKRLARRVPPRLNGPVKNIVRNLFPYRHQQIRISAEDAQRLRGLLNADISRFAEEWEVDVSHWGFGPVVDGTNVSS